MGTKWFMCILNVKKTGDAMFMWVYKICIGTNRSDADSTEKHLLFIMIWSRLLLGNSLFLYFSKSETFKNEKCKYVHGWNTQQL